MDPSNIPFEPPVGTTDCLTEKEIMIVLDSRPQLTGGVIRDTKSRDRLCLEWR